MSGNPMKLQNACTTNGAAKWPGNKREKRLKGLPTGQVRRWMTSLNRPWQLVICSSKHREELESRVTVERELWRWETSAGDEPWKCTQAVLKGCLLGDLQSSPVKQKLVLFLPACSSSLITEALSGSWPGPYMRAASPNNTTCTDTTVPQSVRYPKLPSPVQLAVCCQPNRLRGGMRHGFR
jgi:hypothetical protein